jgi:hypothetical protein
LSAKPGWWATLRVALAAAAAVALTAPGPAASAAGEGAGRRDPLAGAFPLSFDSERIRLEVVGDSLEVRGTYILLCRGRGETPIPLFYPFPRDTLLGGFRMVSLEFRTSASDTAGASAGRWESVPGIFAVRWWIPPCQSDTLVAESVYRQALRADYARYIVTTTRAWGRPLKRAAFEIRLPAGAEPIEFSFPFERGEGKEAVYRYEATDFLPDRDIVVRWQP